MCMYTEETMGIFFSECAEESHRFLVFWFVNPVEQVELGQSIKWPD